ncbi:MAG: hypothetical protein NC300_00010 [Bacteroidales bacterium]|nr:hypothetical protein [Clostridium sp.]MCM1202507.1 hypothetical protein [Bacteroidales bacterium]
MDIRKIILCFAIVILVVVGTTCSLRQSEKPDNTAPGKDGEAVDASEDIPDTLEKVPDEYKNTSDKAVFTLDSTVKEVISNPAIPGQKK